MGKTSTPSLSFDSALSHEPADKRIEILRLVSQSGSISQAARDAGVSYKAAWQAIDTLTNLAGVALVERAVGGTGGGGANTTAAGNRLLAMAARLHQTRRAVIMAASDEKVSLESGPLTPIPQKRTLPTLSGLSVRTSMRNQLPCMIEKVQTRGQVVRVYLATVGPLSAQIVSRITKASAELLGLQAGQEVLALCKATAVTVTASGNSHSKPETQSLDGRAVRISRSKLGDEVSLQLGGGLQLVGFAAAGMNLKTGATVRAQIDEAAVVIALPP
jgi:molybdate transport system regulatory protein